PRIAQSDPGKPLFFAVSSGVWEPDLPEADTIVLRLPLQRHGSLSSHPIQIVSKAGLKGSNLGMECGDADPCRTGGPQDPGSPGEIPRKDRSEQNFRNAARQPSSGSSHPPDY